MSAARLRGLLRLFRFELPFTAGACVLLGQLLALDAFPPPETMIFGFLSIFLLSATALILNDYFDVEIDRVNAPDRPLPSGQVRKSDALWLSAAVALAGLASAAALGATAFLTALVVWIIGVLYNARFKRAGLAGNLMVAFSVGMTFVYGGISVGAPANLLTLWFGAIAFLMDLGEEIAADAMDAEGDRAQGSRSLAVVLGPARALRISAVVFAVLVVVSLVPFLTGAVALSYLLPIGVMDAVVVYGTVRLLDPATRNPRAHIRAIYLSGSVAVLGFIFLRILL